MVKAYLRYSADRALGIITSRECNVVLDRTGKLALSGAVEAICVWNLRQGALVRELKTARASERVTRLCVKSGPRPVVAAGYSDGAVRLWDYEDAQVLQTFQGHRSGVSCLAFDAASHYLASGANDTDIVIWDLAAEAGVARLRGHVDQVTAVLFWQAANGAVGAPGTLTAAGRLVSASKDRAIRIWSIELQICLQTITDHQCEVWSIALNAEQTRLAAGAADKFVRLWELSATATGGDDDPLATTLGEVPRPNGQGSALALNFARPRGVDFEVLVCQGSGKTVEFFRCHDGADVRRRQKRRKRRAQSKKQKKAGVDVADDADGDRAEAEDAGAEGDGGAEEARARAADELSELPPHRLAAKAVSMAWCAKTGELLVGLANNELEAVRLVPGGAGEEGATPLAIEKATGLDAPGHRTPVRAVAVAEDDSLLMSASAEAVKIWNTATGRCVRTIASGYGLCGFFVAGNEHLVLGTKEGHLELYDLRVGELAQQEVSHTAAVYGLAESPDHKGFVSCSADKTLRFFEFTFKEGAQQSVTFQEVGDKATEMIDECLGVAYSPNGKWIAVALLNHTVQMIFADSLKFYLSLYGHRLPVMALDVTSDSQLVASGSADKNVKLWSTTFGNCHKSLRAHDDSVMQVRFLPGTHYLATAGRDRELKLWDCDSYELITALKGHASEILALAVSQDAAFLVTASGDRQIRFWRRSQEQLFLSEERAKELEDRFEQEAEREDLQDAGGGEAVTLRASRRTIESVRSTERLMEILDEAAAMERGESVTIAVDASQNPCMRVVTYVNTLNASNIYEVLLALPFAHALRLLGYICRFLEAVASLPGSKDGGFSNGAKSAADTRLLSAAMTLETPCQAALIAAYVHHHQLAATPSARALVMRLRAQMRTLLQEQKDRIGLSIAGVGHIQRLLRRNSGGMGPPPVPVKPAAKAKAAAPVGGKKRKKA